jgi:hypothetical protein
LRYISSTNHSFCPNGEVEPLMAATHLDSFCPASASDTAHHFL